MRVIAEACAQGGIQPLTMTCIVQQLVIAYHLLHRQCAAQANRMPHIGVTVLEKATAVTDRREILDDTRSAPIGW